MNGIGKIFLFFFTLFLLSSRLFCNNIVVTSVTPISLFLKNIVVENDEIVNVIPANANPHFYEPTPSVVYRLKNAGLFIGVEKSFDGWIERFLPKNCIKVYLIKKNYVNPHIWLSPSIMSEKLKEITVALCSANLKHCKIYKKNAIRFKKKLKLSVERLRKKSSKYRKINFIQFHPAWYYFAQDFGLHIVGTLTNHGVSFSPKKYVKLLDLVKFKNVKYISKS